MGDKRNSLLEDLERITSEIAGLKKMVVLERRPAINGKQRLLKDNLNNIIKKLASSWDNISAVEEIRRQRKR